MPILLCACSFWRGAIPVATLDEYFLDDYTVEEFQGVARTFRRPTKHASNPLVGNTGWTWDRDINFISAQKVGSAVTLCYMGVSAAAELYACRATSTDGISFTKPNLGLISYGGNTNNNIMLAARTTLIGFLYDATETPTYLGVGETVSGGGDDGVYLYSSSDGIAWTLIKTLYSGPLDGNYREGRAITRLADGRYVVYYVGGQLTDRRSPGYFVSLTSDPTGSWTNIGFVIDAKSAGEQRYSFEASKVGDAFIALAGRFVRSTEQIDNVELLTSRDCGTWKTIDAQWFAIGSSGAWDDEMIIPASPPIEVGNDWYFYYTGFGANHAAGLPRNALIGAATLPKGRIASIGTAGTVRLKPITTGAADTFTVNCNASGGSLKVELLDEQNNVIYGYSRDDCDAITTDTYSTAVTWAGRGLIASRTVKVVFVLDSATLHACEIGAA